MNAMMYVRGNRADYDGWARGGAAGWRYDEVLPYFKRSEDNAEFHDSYHGVGGEQHVTSRRWLSTHWEPFLESAAPVGIPRIADSTDPSRTAACWSRRPPSRPPLERRGRVPGASPQAARPDDHAPSPRPPDRDRGRPCRWRLSTANGKRQTARAEREVILSAGGVWLAPVPDALWRRTGGSPAGPRHRGPGRPAERRRPPPRSIRWRWSICVRHPGHARRRRLAEVPAGLAARRAGQALLERRRGRAALALGPVTAGSGLPVRVRPGLLLGARVPQDRSAGADDRTRSDRPVESRQRPPSLGRPGGPSRILNNLLGSDAEVAAMLRALELAREIASKPPFSKHASRSSTRRARCEAGRS